MENESLASIIIMVPRMCLVLMVVCMPFFLFPKSKKENLEPRNIGKAHRLLVLEYYLVELINAAREQKRKPPIGHKPVIAEFNSSGWQAIKSGCRQVVLGIVRKVDWIRGALS